MHGSLVLIALLVIRVRSLVLIALLVIRVRAFNAWVLLDSCRQRTGTDLDSASVNQVKGKGFPNVTQVFWEQEQWKSMSGLWTIL
ncbi:hypothetical protein MRB53_018804 [Persea americana]|uniref:Uncharacterized protein n=1 Tax=Persea americana TaxID=3435 RepID=A0ACC2M8W7_PERAE|nr:hypothetical protein MRB53_018804 [Persea americana]